RERSAEDGEILRKHVHKPALNSAVAGGETVGRGLLLLHAEIGAMVANKFVELLEGPFIEQQINPLASAELALFVLPFAALGAAAFFSLSVPLAHLFEPIVMFSVITHIVVSFTGRVSVPHPHPASKVGCLLVAC